MKHNELRAIAHNIADSLASGIGLMIGIYEMDIFDEAQKTQGGVITVDFLKGITDSKTASVLLKKAVTLYKEALTKLTEKHGATGPCFNQLTASYSIDGLGKHVLITIEDKKGRRSIDEYIGSPLQHVKVLDKLNRPRRKSHRL